MVIGYDHLKDSVELCQRFGRARQQDSAIVLLDERDDRPLGLLESVRQIQDDMAQDYVPSRSNLARNTGGTSATVPAYSAPMPSNLAGDRTMQRAREHIVYSTVLKDAEMSTTPLRVLNIYVQKMKATLTEEFLLTGSALLFSCVLRYRCGDRLIEAEGSGRSKKDAKNACTLIVLADLVKQTRP
mmetsp:Transcript_22513/g.55827  ORF Transcript_22513/g.55827 Transcript_22513/m.55827 type:complete len:185 (-) Transcript_22513:88-642(-)